MIQIDEKSSDKILITISSETIDDDLAMELKSSCRKLLDEKGRDMVFKMSTVKYMVSSGIGVFLYLIQRLRKESFKITIEECSEETKKIFCSLLLNTFIEIK